MRKLVNRTFYPYSLRADTNISTIGSGYYLCKWIDGLLVCTVEISGHLEEIAQRIKFCQKNTPFLGCFIVQCPKAHNSILVNNKGGYDIGSGCGQ